MKKSHNRPLIFAHRGAKLVAPENTLPAFEAAIRLGADGVELDVQYTIDSHLVVFHNPTLEATSDGTGRLTSHSLEQIRALDAGSWFSPGFSGTKIPLLDEVLDLLRDKLLVNIELKSMDSATSGIGADVVAAVRAHGMVDQVVISSFNPMALRRARRTAPEIEGGLLLAADLPSWMRSRLVRKWSRANALHPELAMVDQAYLTGARKAGYPVRVWTVNEESDMRRMIDLEVDAIITDAPDRLSNLLLAPGQSAD